MKRTTASTPDHKKLVIKDFMRLIEEAGNLIYRNTEEHIERNKKNHGGEEGGRDNVEESDDQIRLDHPAGLVVCGRDLRAPADRAATEEREGS